MQIPQHILDGYRKFRSGRYQQESDHYEALATGQSPQTMVISCADSRVDPAMIFAAGPGELFVVRNVAAIVPPYEEDSGYHGTSAALEFAVNGLAVKSIVVMGHGQCGGIAAALAAAEDRPVGRFIGPWISLLDDVRDKLLEMSVNSPPEVRQKALEHMAVQQSLSNLLTFPFVAEAVEAKKLSLEGSWFSIAEGELHWLDWDRGVFDLVEPA